MKRLAFSLALMVLLGAASCSSWRPLFDGSLDNWAKTDFGGQGEIEVRDGRIMLEAGSPLTGITWKGKAPMRVDYELELRAERVDGNDFFCCLTFPVGDEHLSLVLGGWGGSLVGISSLDGRDASDNETMQMIALEDRHAYTVRVRVRREHLECFLDGKRVVNVSLEGRELSLRPEVLECRPLGVCAFATRAAFDSIRWRPLNPR